MKTLLHLKKMVAEGLPRGMRDLPLLRLLCLDSDDLIRPPLASDPSLSREALALDHVSEYLKLEIPGNVGYRDLDRAKAWFPKELEYYIPDLSTGCKQYKALGRLLYAWNYAKVLRMIEPLRSMVDSSLLKQLEVTQVDDPLVFVVGSVCGGTGAGMFLDMGYTMTHLWKRKWSRFNTKVAALLAMPTVFSDLTQGTERIRSNAYASVKELDHFMNKDVYSDPERAFRQEYPYAEQAEPLTFAPFDRAFLFDNSNGRVSVSSAQTYEMMARYVYLLACGELAQDYNSLDNNLNPKVHGVHRLLNKPTCYSSFGYYSVLFPKRVAVQVAAADLAVSVVEQELQSPLAPHDIDALTDAFLSTNKVLVSNQSPQILHALSFYKDSSGQRVNIQDTISGTVANVDLSGEAPENYEAIVREYDTRFSNSDLALFEGDCRREAQGLLRAFRTSLEAEIQKLADPARSGSIAQVHLFVEELYKEMAEDLQSLESLGAQTEKQIPGLKGALETQFLKLRQTASSRSLLTRFTLKNTMTQLLAEAKETLESFWLAKRKAVVVGQALAFYKGDPQSTEEVLRKGALAAVLAEREAYRAKVAALESFKERLLETVRAKRSVADGEFYKVAFDFSRDVRPVIEDVKQKRRGLEEARRRLHAPDVLGSDLDGLADLPREESYRRLVEICASLYAPIFDQWSLDERVATLGDLATQVKTWINFSRPFIMLDSVDASKYGFGDEHNAARFIAIPNTYAGKPCEQILNRCPVRSAAECDRYDACLKRSVLEALPQGTSVGHMAGRHEIHFLSLYHGFSASSLIHLASDAAPVYRNHMLAAEKIHMLGPVQLYDLREALPNRSLERLKDHFYVSFACGWVAWNEAKETFLFSTDADLDLKLPPSVALGSDIGSILDNYHSPQGAMAENVVSAFAAMERRVAERCSADPRGLGHEVLAFLKANQVPLDDDEKRRLYEIGRGLAEGRCSSL
jgi:hypothetical protein